SFAALCAKARLQSLNEAASAALPVVPGPVPPLQPLSPQFPPAARLLHELGLDREAEATLAEAESDVQRAHPGRSDEALCLLYSQLSSGERAYRVGQRLASAQELNRAPQLGRRWLWNCVYPRPYAGLVSKVAEQHGLDSELIYSVMRQESSFRPEVVSPANAVGLLQLMPRTAERLSAELGVVFVPSDLRRPQANVKLGGYYLRKLVSAFDGSLPLAIASYNAGPSAVTYWLEHAQGLELDVFVARIPYEETRSYVERVLGNYARYRYLQRGEELSLALALPIAKAECREMY
ncbi:MAG TPA: lytic transglycosylase domain-containing protein, partial [Polyangiales bacterium]|nr:lytic transglycosylase domain-containing protein [Polyangiales bacterium]